MAPVNANGFVDMVASVGLIDTRVTLVSAMAVNHEIGSVQPLPEIDVLFQHTGIAPRERRIDPLAGHGKQPGQGERRV